MARYGDRDLVDDLKDHDDLMALLERYDMFDVNEQSRVGSGIERFGCRLN